LFSANDAGDDRRTIEGSLVEPENSQLLRILNVKFNGNPYKDFAVYLVTYTDV
jgi:hypothetical protein